MFADDELSGNSESIQGVRKLIDRIAGVDSTVVILGETGTGKELVAKSIHSRSPRCDKPFIAVNCGALPENLIESELFGHRKGSFTGADSNRTGLLEVADGGTLFLDEIGELPKAVQAKLLRFLENGEIRKIGENSPTHCNVRVICATLKNLESMVAAGEFREDLWFRINTFIIRLPSLKERLDDLPDLIRQLVKRFRPNLNLDSDSNLKSNNYNNDLSDILTKQAFKRLNEYEWPGNIRQLANTLEHALVLSDKLPIDVDSLPELLDNRNAAENTGTILIQDRNADARPEVCKNAIDSSVIIQQTTQNKQQNLTSKNSISKESKPKDSLSRLAANLSAFDPSIDSAKIPPTSISTSTSTSTSTPTDDSNSDDLSNPTLPTSLRELESKAITEALQRNDGNKVKAAEELGISLKTLYNKLK
ncbi:MAG: sigma-54 dependent transcriptional regulator [Planctomycetaceae bacterium]|jgi:transcriptional regulator with PAS, ATPase and Fis domain|nr:sigma-54 dependent transcriptional regulator [Planctomycetaceae bacterium]